MQITNNPLQQIIIKRQLQEITNTQKSLNLLEQVLYQKWCSTVMCLNGCNNIYFMFKGKEIRFDEDYEKSNIFINSDILPDDYEREAINMINTLNLAKSNYKEKLQLLITQIKKMPQIIYKIDFIKKAKEYKKKYDNIEEAIKDAEVSIRNHLQYAKKRRKEMYANNKLFQKDFIDNYKYSNALQKSIIKPLNLPKISKQNIQQSNKDSNSNDIYDNSISTQKQCQITIRENDGFPMQKDYNANQNKNTQYSFKDDGFPMKKGYHANLNNDLKNSIQIKPLKIEQNINSNPYKNCQLHKNQFISKNKIKLKPITKNNNSNLLYGLKPKNHNNLKTEKQCLEHFLYLKKNGNNIYYNNIIH